MKRLLLLVVCTFTTAVQAMQVSDGQAVTLYGTVQEPAQTTESHTLLLAQKRELLRRSEERAEVRNQSIDVVIAGLFLVGSGIPGVSDEVKLAANVSASILWLGDSSVRLVCALKKRWSKHDDSVPELRSIVIN